MTTYAYREATPAVCPSGGTPRPPWPAPALSARPCSCCTAGAARSPGRDRPGTARSPPPVSRPSWSWCPALTMSSHPSQPSSVSSGRSPDGLNVIADGGSQLRPAAGRPVPQAWGQGHRDRERGRGHHRHGRRRGGLLGDRAGHGRADALHGQHARGNAAPARAHSAHLASESSVAAGAGDWPNIRRTDRQG